MAGCLNGHSRSMSRRSNKPLAGSAVLLSHCVCLTQSGPRVAAGNPARSHPCTAWSLRLRFAELTTARCLRGVLAHATCAARLRPHQPVISGPQLLVCLPVFARHKEFLVLSQHHKESLAIGPRLRHNNGGAAILLSIQKQDRL